MKAVKQPINSLKACAVVALSAAIAACGGGGGGSSSNSGNSGSGGNGQAPTESENSIVLTNGKIYTVDEQSSWAEAVVIKSGEIVYVGNNAGVSEHQTDDMRVLDLQGKLVLPGFHDSHLHPLEAGSSVAGTCMISSDEDIESQDFIDYLRQCSTRQDGGIDWVLGYGHSIEQLLNLTPGVTPIEILDQAIPNQPVAIMEETSHSMWVNSKALELAGINKDTPNPQGGGIAKDGSGNPTGLLLDNAGDIVYELAFLPPTEELEELHYDGLMYSLRMIRSNGITSMANARVYTRRGYLDVWRRAEAEGSLTARTVLGLWAYPTLLEGQTDDDQIAELSDLYSFDVNSLLNISQIKFYSDGIHSNETAATLHPYPVSEQMPFLVSEDHKGINYFDENRLTKYITALEKVGFDMHIHAIGDRGVRESLNAVESAQATNGNSYNGRHRLTHLEEVDPDDYDRFLSLGVIADFQVAGEWTLPEAGQSADGFIPVRSIYDTGAHYTLSSDWDVSDLSPFTGLEHALSRAEQSLPDLDAAIRGYTINAAYLMRTENKTGSIEVGKFGDLIVVDQNIFDTPVQNISDTKVLLTLLGGEEIYRRSGYND